MIAVARASHPLVVVLVAAVIAALLLALGAPAASAASFDVRLEAGPHRAVTFSATWRVTGSRTLTLASPATVTGSRRVDVPGRAVYLKVTSGPLAGWWVRENPMAYRPGIVGVAAWSPARASTLPAARYELYRFADTGAMTDAAGLALTAPTAFRLDRRAVIDGRRYIRVADGAWAGWWIPGRATAPKRITCSAGSPPTGTSARTVRSVAAASGEIALTFDMGGRLTPALGIVRFLELERVCATIFPTGAAAMTDIGTLVLEEVRDHPELFELGNHTVHHCNLRDGGGGAACPASRPSAAFVTAELLDADATIAAIAGRGTVPYWRPPYGATDAALATVAADAGYPYTVMWSTDTIDWRPISDGGPTAAQIAAKVVANRTAGGIVLMHLGGYQTRHALPAVIQGLHAAGYTPTSLSALYRAEH